jgi:hypothetical protein
MAVSKNTRKPNPDTNQLLQRFFRKIKIPDDGREQAWREAVQHAEAGTLRFPVYESLYFFNLYSQKLADLIEEMTGKFGIHPEQSLYHQTRIQQVRAGMTSDVLERMHGIEDTEEWLFDCLRREEEKRFLETDEVYLEVREREKTRAKEGLPPVIRFLGKDPPATKRSSKKPKIGKPT